MDFYNFEDSSDLENLPLLDIDWPLILQFCFLDDLLQLCFLLDAFIFTTLDEKKEEQKLTHQIFLKDVKEEKNVQIHKHSWLSIIWIFKKLKSLKSKSHKLLSNQNYLLSKTCKKSHAVLQLSLPWTNFCFILIIALSLFGFELSRVNCSCSLFFSLYTHQLASLYKILFSFSSIAIQILL